MFGKPYRHCIFLVIIDNDYGSQTEICLPFCHQVLQGSAEDISPDSRQTKVVVKILKDDASLNEKSLFLEEVSPYR